jgi:hypothetical protein
MSRISPIETAARWNAADTSEAPRARAASPTVAKLQDHVFQLTMSLLQGLATAAPALIATDLLFDRLRAEGIKGEIVSHIDEDGCTACITVQVDRFAQLTETLDSMGYEWQTRDMHHGPDLNIVTLCAQVSGQPVFISATAPVTRGAPALRAA